MDFAADHHHPDPEEAIQPPMGELLSLLRSNGFPVTTDDYVSLLKIVEYFGHEGLDSLGQRICPIIATTPEEQERFYHVFEAYKKSQELNVVQPAKGNNWMQWLTILAALLLVAAIIIIEEGRHPFRAPIGLPQSNPDTAKLALGETYQQDLLQTGMFSGREGDTAAVDVRWEDAGRGEIGQGFRLQHRFTEPGLHRIRRSISSAVLPLSKAADTLSVFVCALMPRLTISAPTEPVMAGRAVDLHAAVTSGKEIIRAYAWRIDAAAGGQILRQTDTPGIIYTFDTAGIYNIRCTPLVDAADAACVESVMATLMVVDTGRQYALSFTGDAGPIPVKARLKWWPSLLLLLLASAISFRAFRRKAPEKKGGEEETQPAPAARKGPPYEVPFLPVSVGDIIVDKPLRRFVHQLRYGAEEEVAELHVQKTIGATVRAGGLTELVFAPRRKAQEYLLFTDNTAPQGMLSQLYRFVVDLMEAECVPLTRFYYDQDFNCFNAAFPAGTTLRNIADNYGYAIPIVLGDGTALLEGLAPIVRAELLQEFARWEHRLLISPTPAGEWGIREQVLGGHFFMSAADATSLLRLGQQLRSSASLRRIDKQNAISVGSEEPEFRDIASLRAYLGGDEALFQWLCALCIYPKPRWELLIGIGRAILGRYGRLADLRYDILLQLCRIPWLAGGSFPQRLRMEMLKELSVDNEIAARAALLTLLTQIDKQYTGDYLFSPERNLQHTISRFVLYAHDPAAYPSYADAVDDFRVLFKEGKITDIPLRKYLDKPNGGSWPTPLRQVGEPVSVSRYFDIKDEAQQRAEATAAAEIRKKQLRRKTVAAGALIILAGLWSTLFFGRSLRNDPRLGKLYTIDQTQQIELSYRVEKDFSGCGDSSNDFSLLPGTLSVNGQPYPLRFDAETQTLNASVPYAALQESATPAVVNLGTGGSNASTIGLERLSSGGVFTATCTRYEPVFGAGVLPDALNELWAQENGQLMNIILDRRQIYYSAGGVSGFDRYQIDTVIHAGGIYKVIARAYPEYNVFIIANIQAGSFGLIACEQRFERLEDALNVSELCGKYETMKLYYDHKDTGRIYLPVAPPDLGFRPLVAGERAKVLDKLIGHAGGDEDIYYEQYDNSFYIRSQKPYDLSKELSAYNVVAAAHAYRKSIQEIGRNPFQRPYLTLSFRPSTGIKSQIPDSGLKNPTDPNTTVRKDTARSLADLKAEAADRSNLAKAKKMLDAGDLDGAQTLYRRLQNSKNKTISAEAKGRMRDIVSLKAQQKAAADAAEKQRLEDERKKRAYDSMMQNNKMPQNKK